MLHRTLRAFVVAMTLSSGLGAADAAAAADTLKSEIDSFFQRLDIATNGRVHWTGADSIDVSENGDEAVATIVNGRLSVRDRANPKPLVTVVLDRIEIRRRPGPTGSDLTELAISLPPSSAITTAEGDELTLGLKDARMVVLLEGAAERQREMTFDIAGGRLDEKAHAAWAKFGSLAGHWKTIRHNDGSWHAPIEAELKELEFLIPEAPLAGRAKRVAYGGESAGPDLAAIDALRDKAAELRENFRDEPQKRAQEMFELLPQALGAVGGAKGSLTVENLTAKRPDGETLVSLSKAWLGGALSGLDGAKAGYRITLGHDGLALAPSLLPENRVPRTAELDFGLEDIPVATLRSLAGMMTQAGSDMSADERQKMLPQVIATAMSLNPIFRLYDAMVDFKDASIAASGNAKRAAPPPFGYAAEGDVTVRGFDALGTIASTPNERARLMLLKFIGESASNADGAAVTQFHLASQPGKPITVNGNDISLWFGAGSSPPGQGRVLRLVDPPLVGDDVRGVQKVVMADGRTDGIYDGMTALAVMRFQKAHGLNINGVVDAATRDKLGLSPPPPTPKNSPTPKN